MEYTQAKLGRIFTIRFDAQEDILVGLKEIIKKENIPAGIIHFMGALTNTDVVLGPTEKKYPPNPIFWNFDDVKEVIGLGIFALEDGEPKIHIHAGIGNDKETKVGCIRIKSEVYLTIECILFEFMDSNITRKLDARYEASLLNFENK